MPVGIGGKRLSPNKIAEKVREKYAVAVTGEAIRVWIRKENWIRETFTTPTEQAVSPETPAVPPAIVEMSRDTYARMTKAIDWMFSKVFDQLKTMVVDRKLDPKELLFLLKFAIDNKVKFCELEIAIDRAADAHDKDRLVINRLRQEQADPEEYESDEFERQLAAAVAALSGSKKRLAITAPAPNEKT